MLTVSEKYELLKKNLKEDGSAAIAFSGGVDSTFLLFAAKEALGEKTLAVTVSSPAFPAREEKEAENFCQREGIRQVVLPVDVLSLPEFSENSPDRCYFCKRELFSRIRETAAENGMLVVAEGSNVDDLKDFRPGMRAVRELGIRSPLKEAGFTKAEIRKMSELLGLPTWDKPSRACLASRFAYGERITGEKLKRVDAAEGYLAGLGFTQLRVRLHGDLARLELLPEEMPRILAPGVREELCAYLKSLGFLYVTLDLQGFRSGSMNEALNAHKD